MNNMNGNDIPILKIIFMGTPDFSVPALQALVEKSDHEVIAVYSQPPRPSGRGQKLKKSPIHTYADENNIPVYTPKSLKNQDNKNEFVSLGADVAIVAAYGLILPQEVLDGPKYGCLNIHASLLPRWRGAAPIQRAIWAGDSQSGITIMQMDKGLDTGDMISKRSIDITNEMTSKTLHDHLSEMGGEMVVEDLNRLAKDGRLSAEKQDDSQSIYAKMLAKEDGLIDWSQSAIQIDRQIRALNPWPGTYTILPNGKILKILKANVIDQAHEAKPGTVINDIGLIQCGENTSIEIESVKPENSKAMDFKSAINGGHIAIQDQFE